MNLTENFTLDEFLVSQTAVRNDIDMTPPQFVIENLADLCVNVLQPLRSEVDSPIRISSGYRPEELNTKIGGSKTSAHMEGRAADFTVIGLSPYDTVKLMMEMDLVFDQIILEFKAWVHAGIANHPRSQILTAWRENGLVQYSAGLMK